MHFDDRLTTVLQHRASGARAARVQFRQLIDLLGKREDGADPVLARAAFRRLDSLSRLVPIADRARIVAEVGARIRGPLLVAYLAEGDAEIALAALSRAVLSDADWQVLIPQLPMRARGLLRHRRTLPRGAVALLDRLGVRDRVLPEPAREQASPASMIELEEGASSPDQTPQEPRSSIASGTVGKLKSDLVEPLEDAPSANAGNLGALVRRIEAFQRAREQRGETPAGDAPRLPLGEDTEPAAPRSSQIAFHFTTDQAGQIDWAEGSIAPLVVGMMLATPAPAHIAPVEPLAAAFTQRGPVRGAPVIWPGPAAIAGDWIVDAAPRFARLGGSFTGYVGRCRRPAPVEPDRRALDAAERLRQLLHELRTPVTAIRGLPR